MKIFVSAQLDDKEAARSAFRLLEQHGHSITHDWTRTDNLPASYAQNRVEAGRRAARDIAGVLEADVYILLTSNERCGKGMYVELGAALARAETGFLGHVYLVGPKKHESIFYFHPKVTSFETMEECASYLSESSVDAEAFAS